MGIISEFLFSGKQNAGSGFDKKMVFLRNMTERTAI